MDLEVAPNDEEVNALPMVDLTGLLDGGVDSVEGTMTLTLRQLGTPIARQSLTQPSTAMRIVLSVLQYHTDPWWVWILTMSRTSVSGCRAT